MNVFLNNILNYLILLIYILLNTKSISQNFEYGEEFKKENKKIHFQGIVGQKGDVLIGVSSLYNNEEEFIVNQFDYNTLKLVKRTHFSFPSSQNETFFPHKFFLVNDQLMVAGYKQIRNKSTKIIGLYKIELNGDIGSFMRVDSIKNVGLNSNNLYKIIQGNSKDSFYYFTSKLNIFNSSQNLILKQYDKNGDLISTFTKSIKIDKKLDFYDVEFAGMNRFYFLAEHTISRLKNIRERVIQNNIHHLICWNIESGKMKHIQLRLKKKWIDDLKLSSYKNECIVAGNYLKPYELSVDGTVYVRVNEEFKIIAHKLSPYQNTKKIKSENKTLQSNENIVLQDVKSTNNGNTAVVSENYLKETQQYIDPVTNSSSYTDLFYYKNTVVSWLDTTGNLINEQIINKEQVSANDGGYYSSICTVMLNDTMLLILNDNLKNVDKLHHVYQAKTSLNNVEPHLIFCPMKGSVYKKKLFNNTSFKIETKNSIQERNNLPLYIVLQSNRSNKIIRLNKY